MTNNQNNLNGPLDLRSPIFKPKPGWGGKINNWFKNNFASKILPVLSISTVVVGAYFYLLKHNNNQAPVQEISQNETMEAVVRSGQGLTHVARTVISEYLAHNVVDISSEQKIYAETYLVNLIGRKPVTTGEVIMFQTKDVVKAIEESKYLTPYQLEAWGQYIK